MLACDVSVRVSLFDQDFPCCTVECWRGTHAVVWAPLAITVLLFYVLGLPICSAITCLRNRAAWEQGQDRASAAAHLCHQAKDLWQIEIPSRARTRLQLLP